MLYEEAMAYLKKNGRNIGKDTSTLAKKVISAYEFHYAAPGDPGGQALLTIAVEEYASQPNKSFVANC